MFFQEKASWGEGEEPWREWQHSLQRPGKVKSRRVSKIGQDLWRRESVDDILTALNTKKIRNHTGIKMAFFLLLLTTGLNVFQGRVGNIFWVIVSQKAWSWNTKIVSSAMKMWINYQWEAMYNKQHITDVGQACSCSLYQKSPDSWWKTLPWNKNGHE